MASKLEYLKRYMSKEDSNDTVKKKKKSKKKIKDPGGFRIIDTHTQSSVDLDEKWKGNNKNNTHSQSDDDDDRFALIEEKPQIAGEFDERPALMTGKWKNVEESNKYNKILNDQRSGRNPTIRHQDSSPQNDNLRPVRLNRRHDSSSDEEKSIPKIKNRHISDDDTSPPRRNRRHDSSSSDTSKNVEKGKSSTNKRRQEYDSDNSPPRERSKHFQNVQSDSDNSPPRKPANEEKSDSDASPPRTKSKLDLMKKTLDGKKAGLQKASSLKTEMDKLRTEEKARMEALNDNASGKRAKTIVRGRLKEKQEEEERQKAKSEISEQVQEQYARWGKGLKQMAHERSKLEDDQREMSKAFARSADDTEMNDQLKGIEREEDPMLAYIQSKRKKIFASSGVKEYPEYKGPPPPPNRFGIKPGYRWDGVDRSTGFEKRLFEHSNKKKAVAEEAYKWSTEDM